LADLELPECFGVLRRRLEHERGSVGTKDFIAILRLLEKHSLGRVAAAVQKALGARAATPDVVALYLYPDPPTEPGTFLLAGRPQLRAVRIAPPQVGAYRDLLETGP
jgi:hypothetical protein